MKKRILNLLLTILIIISVSPTKVFAAATASATITVSTSSTVVGNSGTATLTINSNEHIGQIYGTFTCGGLGSKDLRYSIGASDTPSKSKSYTINWKASTVGKYTCEVTGLEIGTLESQEWPTVSASSKTIQVIGSSGSNNTGSSSNKNNGSSSNKGGTTADKKEYSSDNTLASLTVEGQTLTPAFNKDTLEYQLSVDQTIEKIKVDAKPNNNKASVTGTGEINLSQGKNTIEIKVTAENGNEKIYKLLVMVEDKNPIKVVINNKNYTVVKKNNDLIEKLEHFDETKIKINEAEVIAYQNAKTKLTLVLLKDEENKIDYYIYNKIDKTYTKYSYIKIGTITLQLLANNEKLTNFKKYQTTIQNETVSIYKIEENNKVGLIYGTNIKTGNTDYYVYDAVEETLSRYYDEEINIYKEKTSKFKEYLMITIGIVSLATIITIIVSLIKTKGKRKRKYV